MYSSASPYPRSISSSLEAQAPMASSSCTVSNVIPEDLKGYIEQNDLLAKLRTLYPEVKKDEEFRLEVRLYTPSVLSS